MHTLNLRESVQLKTLHARFECGRVEAKAKDGGRGGGKELEKKPKRERERERERKQEREREREREICLLSLSQRERTPRRWPDPVPHCQLLSALCVICVMGSALKQINK